MNKRNLNIILSVLLVFIWGAVVYKYFGKPKVQNNELPIIHSNKDYSYKEIKDTFNLQLNNRDPFKTTKYRAAPAKTKAHIKSNSNTIKKKTEIWPKIQYFGFVKGEKNKTKLAIIKVNNKLYRKRERERIENIYILKAYGDSLIIDFKGKKKTITK